MAWLNHTEQYTRIEGKQQQRQWHHIARFSIW